MVKCIDVNSIISHRRVNSLKSVFPLLILWCISCTNNTEATSDLMQVENSTQFDLAGATAIIEKRSKEFEQALTVGDSIAVGEIYTVDTKIIPYLNGRNEIIEAAGSMIRHHQTLQLTIKNLWGDENIIIEDAWVEFYNSDGEVTSQGDVLLVWKNDGGKWRIFRDVYKPDQE